MKWLMCFTLLILSITWDVKTHRIPNQVILVGMFTGFIFSFFSTAVSPLNSIEGAIFGLMVFMPFYLLRILGAGDVKLLSAVGFFVGFPGVLFVALFSGLGGGVLSIVYALRHHEFMQMWKNTIRSVSTLLFQIESRDHSSQWVMAERPKRLPYALAIAFGTLFYVLSSQHLIG